MGSINDILNQGKEESLKLDETIKAESEKVLTEKRDRKVACVESYKALMSIDSIDATSKIVGEELFEDEDFMTALNSIVEKLK